ncbi:hypothetical protein BDV96DRAFT_654047 [Lophiotrema nucula]|uniref:Heterokaryon incompatibility domain-containing protein n=1 Tax=Lophiotrema nucula TaxID=690887 RepID=A0A6A5YJQ8_9PLEO|nr:hypothetical protein BDV96DRAFT_654047 [Lophiotrema nucula]
MAHVSPSPSSPAGIARAKEWYHNCIAEHQGICPPAANRLPTRVIEVGSESHDPFLYETGPDEEGTYAALSYCWGKTRTLVTTIANYPDMTAGFSIQEAPLTFRDAIIFARGRGQLSSCDHVNEDTIRLNDPENTTNLHQMLTACCNKIMAPAKHPRLPAHPHNNLYTPPIQTPQASLHAPTSRPRP